jgi:hypothetical protein
MRIATVITCAGFLLLPAAPTEAQRSSPAGAQPLQLTPGTRQTAPPRDSADLGQRWRPLHGVLGGVVGGLAGGYAGAMAGLGAAQGCQGEYCAYTSLALGFAVGESLGVALGTHVGARGKGDVMMSTLTSFGILVGGLVTLGGLGGEDLLVVLPALQIAAALAMEKPDAARGP